MTNILSNSATWPSDIEAATPSERGTADHPYIALLHRVSRSAQELLSHHAGLRASLVTIRPGGHAYLPVDYSAKIWLNGPHNAFLCILSFPEDLLFRISAQIADLHADTDIDHLHQQSLVHLAKQLGQELLTLCQDSLKQSFQLSVPELFSGFDHSPLSRETMAKPISEETPLPVSIVYEMDAMFFTVQLACAEGLSK